MDIKKVRQKYNYEALENAIKRDKASFNENYYKNISLTCKSRIEYLCKCNTKYIKALKQLCVISGAFCEKCTHIMLIEKRSNTNIKKYGVKVPLQNKDIRNKMEETNIKRYGAKNVFQNEEIKEKSKQTLIKLYGVDHNSKTPEFKEKYKNTMLQNYGVEHNMYVPEIAEKCSKSAYKRKEIVKLNGETIYLQGFEPQAYEIILKTYNEDEIITDNKFKPEIWWYDSIIKYHRYYPDFYIPKDNLIIEIKSERTFSLDDKKEKIRETKLMCNFLNYNFELWILNEKGDILEKHI